MAALAEKAAVEEGLWLQQCRACGTRIWPMREVCPSCLAVDLQLTAVDPEGGVLATTVVRASLSPQMAGRLHLPLSSVSLAPGATGIAFAGASLSAGETAMVTVERDPSGTAVLLARPADTPLVEAVKAAQLVGPSQALRLVDAPAGVPEALGGLGHHSVEDEATAAVVWGGEVPTLMERALAALKGLGGQAGPAPLVLVQPPRLEGEAAPLRTVVRAIAGTVMPRVRVVLLFAAKDDASAVARALCTTREVVAPGVPQDALARWWLA
ncbi:MAG: zinc ribbon domain-containing protein [Devosia sp.]